MMTEDDILLEKEKSCIFEKRCKDAQECHQIGNKLYTQGIKSYEQAIKFYEKALNHLEFEPLSWNYELTQKHRDEVNIIRLPVYSNLSACTMQEESSTFNVEKAKEYVTLAYELDPKNPKLIYRLGYISLLQGDLEKARSYLSIALKDKPNDRIVRKTYERLLEKEKEEKQKEKQVWKGKMNKTSTQDIAKGSIVSSSFSWKPVLGILFFAIVLSIIHGWNQL